MIRYFQINGDFPDKAICPLYEKCRTGRDLPRQFCTNYKCNTFYQIDTIQLYLDSPWVPKAIANCGLTDDKKEPEHPKSDISRIVANHFGGNSNGNGNGHGKNGNEKTSRTSPISMSFSR